MSLSGRSKKTTQRPADPDSDRNFRLVQQAIAAVFKQPGLAPHLRRITVDVRNGNWSATVLVNGEANDAARLSEVAARKNKRQKGSQTLKFEFKAG